MEKIPAASDQGKTILDDLAKVQKVGLPEQYLTPSFKGDLERNVFLMVCKTCKLVEAVDVKRRESLFKTKLRAKSEKSRSVAGAFIIAGACVAVAILTIFYLEVEGLIDIQVIVLPGFTVELAIIASVMVAGALAFFAATGLGFVKLMRRHPAILEFTFKLHRAANGDNKLYFFEHVTEKEQLGFKATLARSIYGSILVLGIGILVIENFFTIPDLREYMWTASYVTIVAILVAFPLIMMYLYISPLLTKEINLYFHDKKNRVVKNVGEWLDNALQFFAVIDIILTFIIILDSNLEYWILVIVCLVLVVFAWILVFTSIFNNHYHAEMKNDLKEYLKGKYLLPVRHVQLAQNYHYCQNCGALVDFIHEDKCTACKEAIPKCMICGDVMATRDAKYSKDDGCAGIEDRLMQLARKVERKMDGVPEASRVSDLSCPECGGVAHVDELYSWLALRGTCPACKKEIHPGGG